LTARRIMLTKGARENRYRPAIDPLFRSAAVTHGPRVIGVILTGMLDDGTSGMQAVQQCGGATVVQDPAEAEYPQMPESVLNAMTVRYCVPIADMGKVLDALARGKRRTGVKVPKHIHTEAVIAERVLSDVGQVQSLGSQAPYNCPNCGGVLWEVKDGKELRYRCHTGHAYSAASLLTSQSDKIEETLWVSLRMFEERKNLLNSMGRRAGRPPLTRWYEQRAKEADVHVQRIRAMLMASQSMQSGKGLEPAKRRRKMKVV
jgi:two-component system chemotaxis response regulator CheB